MKSFPPIPVLLLIVLMAVLSACGQAHAEETDDHADEAGGHGGDEPVDLSDVDYAFTLETEATSGFLYRDEEGMKNPVLRVPAGAKVGLTVVNGDGVEHDLTIDVLGLHSGHVVAKGESSSIAFTAETPGSYPYYCTLPGHREAGMEGVLVIEGG
jgi:nitrite reductase (NO-forming)